MRILSCMTLSYMTLLVLIAVSAGVFAWNRFGRHSPKADSRPLPYPRPEEQGENSQEWRQEHQTAAATVSHKASSVPREMLSASENRHMDSLDQIDHGSYEQDAMALGDLLSAGIIDRPEYNDRLRQLRAETR